MDTIFLKNVRPATLPTDINSIFVKNIAAIDNTAIFSNNAGCFSISNLPVGQGATVGNSLRRSLLSELTGYGIYKAKINNIEHELQATPWLKEDTFEVLAHLGEIKFKENDAHLAFLESTDNTKSQLQIPKYIGENTISKDCIAYINVQGPAIITASMLQFDTNFINVVNPDLYIATITQRVNFYAEIHIALGNLEIFQKKAYADNILFSNELKVLPVFCPVTGVNFNVRVMYNIDGNLKDSLLINIYTDGSRSPTRCIIEALELLISTFSCILGSLVIELNNFSSN